MLKFLTVVLLTLFTMSSIAEDKYDEMINKGLLCSPKKMVFDKLDREVWVPAIRSKNLNGFMTYIFFKETDDRFGKVGRMRIYEVDKTDTIACLISESEKIQWNGSFWDTFILRSDGLYI